MGNTIHVAFCTDVNYLMPTGIAILSVCENNKQETVVFHLVLTDEGKDLNGALSKVKKIVEDYGQSLQVYYLSAEFLKEYVCSGVGHVSTTGFARIFLPDLLSQDISRVLYLDGDLVVLRNLRTLYETSLNEESPLGAITDTFYYDRVKQNAKSADAKEYFNSGVLLIDLETWRKEQIRKKMVDSALDNLNTFKMLDQDVINHVLKHRITPLPIRYNALISWYENASYVLSLHDEKMTDFLTELQNPVISHYIGSQKPWDDISCPKRTEWILFYSISPWAAEALGAGQSFERSSFVLELRRYYWSDPDRYVKLITIVNRYFLACLKLKRKQFFLDLVQGPIILMSKALEKLYKYKSR